MMDHPVVRISHRGGGSLAPENSIEGIEAAILHGVDMVEVDVRITRDGWLALSHDPLLHGTQLAIASSTIDELRDASPHTATLDDALKAARGRVRVNLDIKDPRALDAAVEAVRAHRVDDAVIICCLEAPCLVRAAELAPGIPRFFSYPPDYGGASSKAWLKPAVNATVALMRMTMHMRLPGMLKPIPGSGATIYYRLITPRLIGLARTLGINLYTWTVDDASEMRRLVALGVDGVTSNRPDLLAGLARDMRQRAPAKPASG